MCVIIERDFVICGHRTSVKAPCAHSCSGRFMRGFHKKCKFERNASSHFDICHDCTHYWKAKGVSQTLAVVLTRDYKETHNERTDIPPEFVYAARRRMGEFRSRKEQMEQDDIERLQIRKQKQAARGSHPLTNLAQDNDSSCTLWPRLLEEVRHEPSYNPNAPQPGPQTRFPPESSRGNSGMPHSDSGVVLSPNTFVAGNDSDDGITLQDLPPARVRTEQTRVRVPDSSFERPRDSVNLYSPYRFDGNKGTIGQNRMSQQAPSPAQSSRPGASAPSVPLPPHGLASLFLARAPGPSSPVMGSPRGSAKQAIADRRAPKKAGTRVPLPVQPRPSHTSGSAGSSRIRTPDTGKGKSKESRSPAEPKGRPPQGGSKKPPGNWL